MAKAALERGIDLFTGYGMSETCPILSLAHLDSADLDRWPEEQAVIRAKTGRPLPLVNLRIVDPDMDERGRTTARRPARWSCAPRG